LCFRETKLETAGSSVAVAAVAMCPPCGRKGYLGLERSYSREMENSRFFVTRDSRPVARDSWRRSGEPEEVFLSLLKNVFSFVVRELRRFLNMGLSRLVATATRAFVSPPLFGGEFESVTREGHRAKRGFALV